MGSSGDNHYKIFSSKSSLWALC